MGLGGGVCVCVFYQSCLTPRGLWPSRLPVRGILQAGILEWVAIFISMGCSPPRDGTQVPDIARVIGESLKVGEESTCNAGDLGWGDPLEKELATRASLLAWRLSGTDELLRLQPTWSYSSATTPAPGKPQDTHLRGGSPVSPGHGGPHSCHHPGILCG